MSTFKRSFMFLFTVTAILLSSCGPQTKEVPVTLIFRANESVDAFLGQPIPLPTDINYSTTMSKISKTKIEVSDHPTDHFGQELFSATSSDLPKMLALTYDFQIADTGNENCYYSVDNSEIYEPSGVDCYATKEIIIPIVPVFEYCLYTVNRDQTLYCSMDNISLTATETVLSFGLNEHETSGDRRYIVEMITYFGGDPTSMPDKIVPSRKYDVPISVTLP